jgi:hypothetical protein
VVIVLAIGPKVLGSSLSQDDGFLRAIVFVARLPSDGNWCRRSHVVRFYRMLKNPAMYDTEKTSSAKFTVISCRYFNRRHKRKAFYGVKKHIHNQLQNNTERHGRVVNTPASYSGSPGFKSRSTERLSWLRFSWFFSIPPGECRNSTLKLDHARFLPNPFHFIINLSPFHSTLYSLRCWKALSNKLSIYTWNK